MEPLKPVPESNQEKRSWDHVINRIRLGKEREVVEHRNYRSRHLFEVAANAVTFKECDFSFSVIERSYFRNAVFENCKFTGAKVLDSSFRSASFSNCDFQYTTVQRSNVPVPELLRNLPGFPNVRREFLQQLRANATSVGDSSHINQLVAKELDAERDYWREARKRSSAYYDKKYGSFRGIARAHWNSVRLAADRFVWGHGESIAQLLLATMTAITILGLVRWIVMAPGLVVDLRIRELWDAIKFTWAVYIDLPIASDALDGQRVWGSCVLLVRYLSIGLFISVVFRKMSKR